MVPKSPPKRRPSFPLGVLVAALAALAFATAAGAAESSTPVSQTFFNPCTGETFVAEGRMTTRVDFRISADGRIHETWHVNLHAMTAKGLVTGAKYVVQEQFNEGINADADAAPSTQHHIFKQHYVRSGETGELLEEDDFYLWFHIHLTINSNGVPTSIKLATSDEVCR